MAASALVFSGRPIETVTSLACLVDIDAFKAIMAYLRQRKGGKPTRGLLGLAHTLKAIAKHQERMSEQHVQRMARICANYAEDLEQRPTKSQVRMERFEDERFLAALLHLPGCLLEEAGLPKTSPRRAKSLAQIAVAIEIELHTALRVGNLVALNLQNNIQVVNKGRQARWILRFDRHETKNRALLVHELPPIVVQRIKEAFRFYQQTNGWLFPGKKGGHKLPSLLGVQVKREVERRLGIAFNIHLFRALGATTQVKENENGLEIARAFVGDRSDRVVRTHYTAAAERHLIAKGQETIQRVRLRTAPLVPVSRRRKPADPESKP
jgi:integrase